MKKWHVLILLSLFGLLCACVGYNNEAPVRDADTMYLNHHAGHRVQPGESLYSIAWHYNENVRELASVNQISPPYHVHPGEFLRIDVPSASGNL